MEIVKRRTYEQGASASRCRRRFPRQEDDLWYVFRYTHLTNQCRNHFRFLDCEVFLPFCYKKRTNSHTGQTQYREWPIVSGYIFVHAPLKEARELGKAVNMAPLRRKVEPLNKEELESPIQTPHERKAAEERQYYAIRDAEMRQFMRAIDLCTNGFQLFDASSINMEKDDQVIILDGELKGTRGYLKSEQGKEGGLVMVPLGLNNESNTVPVTPTPLLCYGIPAKAEQIGITAFAKGNRHARDNMKAAFYTAAEAMSFYRSGKDIPLHLHQRLVTHLRRFQNVQFDTNIQRAKHQMLLYRIYTLLELEPQRQKTETLLAEHIIPDYERRVQKSKKRGFCDTEKTFANYLALRDETIEARAAHLAHKLLLEK